MTMEETRRRNEASMARKRAVAGANPATANSNPGSDSPTTPNGTGAMDSLLEKLRAAAPQTRDQRDRRRRARLKDKHEVRIASGQKMPDLAELTKTEEADDDTGVPILSSTIAELPEKEGGTSEGEDVADRAASMLQGLRGDASADSDSLNQDGSLRVRRRRESAEVERRDRRRRRGPAASSSSSGITGNESSIPEPSSLPREIAEQETRSSGSAQSPKAEGRLREESPATPTTTVSPPTPKSKTAKQPLETVD